MRGERTADQTKVAAVHVVGSRRYFLRVKSTGIVDELSMWMGESSLNAP